MTAQAPGPAVLDLARRISRDRGFNTSGVEGYSCAAALLDADEEIRSLRSQLQSERDRLAAQAMQAMIAGGASTYTNDSRGQIVDEAYEMAEAMIQRSAQVRR
jgi:hypothetical protein